MKRLRRALRVMVPGVVLASSAGSCGSGTSSGPASPGVSLGARQLAATDVVVATVDGTPISAADVAAEARRTGKSPREALDALIDLEVLAAQAQKSGLAGAPDVDDAGRRAAVRAYLHARFETEFTPADISEADVQTAFDRSGAYFNHPELADVSYLLVQVPQGASPAEEARALAAAFTLRHMADTQAAAHALDDTSFRGLATALPDPQSLNIIAQQIRTPRDGYTEEPFAAAAFSMTQPGDLAGPVRSTYGWHILRLNERVPVLTTTLAQAEPEIRQKIFPAEQTAAFQRFYQGLAARHQIVEHAELLLGPTPESVPPPTPPPMRPQ
jgi:hypothetical protein